MPEIVQVYTDGGCTGNPGPGGWAALILNASGEPIELSGGETRTTNNRMELIAVIQALNYLQINSDIKTDSLIIEIFTDSQYVKNGITAWISKWLRNGWKTAAGKPVKNSDLWLQLHELNSAMSVSWKWIRGHAGNHWNERCDKLVEFERNNFS